MKLPIDARMAPFKQKYIDEETPMFALWFQFGMDAADETHHISDARDDIFIGLTKQQAETIVRARRIFVNAVLTVLNGES